MLFFKHDIVQEILNELTPNYKEMLSLYSNKTFLYVNSIEILRYYRLTKIKSFDYDLYNKVNFYKKDLFLLNMINEAKKNNFYKPNITFLYCTAVSFAADEVLKKQGLTTNPFYLDSLYAKSKGINLSNRYIFKSFKNCFLYSLTELDFLSNCLKNTYNEPATIQYVSESINQFKHAICQNSIFVIYNKFLDIFRSNNLKSKNYVYKKINFKNKIYKDLINKNIDFESIKSEIKTEAQTLLNAVNQALYFDKQADLIEIAANNNWQGITDYYNFINKQKISEKERKKAYKIKNKTMILSKKIKEALKPKN